MVKLPAMAMVGVVASAMRCRHRYAGRQFGGVVRSRPFDLLDDRTEGDVVLMPFVR
jgi:hypothetical protein